MKVLSIKFREFRNIVEQSLRLNSGLNVFQGVNGQGKTNLIEGIYLLSHGKSFRTSENKALVLHGSPLGTRVVGDVEKKGLKSKLEFRIQGGKKNILVNEKTVSGSFLRKNFPSVLFSPESLLVVKQSPQHRRVLIDDLAMGIIPGFLTVYEECTRLLKQKNALLKKIRKEQVERKEGHRLFHSLTDLFFAKSAQLVALRLEVMERICPFLQKEFGKIMGDPLVELEMDYLMSGDSALGKSKKEIINAMYKRWEVLAHQETALGQSLVGPHKHDVQFRFNGQEARLFCSQGQQRAIILAFKMAHIKLHWAAHEMYPLLLLDDVLSELDQMKQDRFLENLMETQSQILMTATDASRIPKKARPSVFRVEVGTFRKSDEYNSGGPCV